MTSSNGFHLSDLQYWRELKILAERASRDVLSGLLNRETATDYIEQCLKHMHPGDSCALFIIDLDNFKLVNDTLGHQAGDEVIRLAAKALAGCFRATDIVGRLGGDEFFALLSGNISEDAARDKARSICEALQFSIGVNPSLHVSSSVGVYIATGETRAFEKLYERADAALYEAKAEGRNRYHISTGESVSPHKIAPASMPHVPVPMSLLLDNMEEGVALLEVGENAVNVLYASPAVFRMLGTDSSALSLPCELSVFGGVHPDDLEEFERRLRDGLAGGRIVEYEHRFAWGCGWRWCRARAVRSPMPCSENVMMVLVRDISGSRRSRNDLLMEGEFLKLALDRGARVLWEVDVASRRFRLFNGRRLRSSGAMMEDFPEGLIRRGWVHPDSVDRLRAFARDMLSGRPAGGGAFVLRHTMSRRFDWFSVQYRILPDMDRSPLRIVGIAEPISVGIAWSVSGKERLWEQLRPNLFCYVRGDLTEDRMEELWIEGRTLTQHLRGATFQSLVLWEKKRLFRREDGEEFFAVFSRRALLDAFDHGREWVAREFRCVDSGGTVRWLSYVAHLARHPLTGNVQVFGFLQDTERRHEREAALAKSSGDLPVHGIYSRDMAKKLAGMVLESGSSPRHMLALVQMFGVSGPREAGRREFIIMALSLLLGADCVMGEYDETSFTVFRPDAFSRAVTRQRIDDAFAFVRQALSDGGLVSGPRFVAAVACADLGGMDYDDMLDKAERCCARWKDAPSDTVIFMDDLSPKLPTQTDPQQTGLENLENDDESDMDSPMNDAVPAAGDAVPVETPTLSDAEKDVAIACLDVLLREDSADVAMREVLRHLGTHYQADRAYTLSLAEDGRTVRASHEWVAEGRSSLKRRLSGMALDSLPLLWRCLRENRPVCLERRAEPGGRSRDWRFMAFPLAPAEGGPDGVLCVENPRRPIRVDALSAMLLPHMERVLRFSGAAGSGRGMAAFRDSLTGLQNLHAYMDRVCRLTSDTCTSMGAFILDMPHLAAPTETQSRSRNSRVVLYLAETLGAVFGRELLFRTRSDEFVALCANCTQNVFLARVLRAQSMLQRRYPGQLRFGYTWSEGLFSGDKLVKEARTIMLCGQLETSAGGAAHPELGMRGPGMAGTDGLESFTIHLQPKVDMRTGAVIGAEALVRGLDGSGGVVMPARFIEAMERTGAIRELDLHVLNMTLSVMEGWRRRGLRPIPVSVNFSRATLFSPSAPGSVLALFSRYPMLAPSSLEIEVSENAGNVESRTLERAMAGFRPFGVRFGLDDFGTRYANLSLFTSVPFDTVKLDRSLIRDLAHNSVGRALVGDIVRLCLARNMACVAEGVENQTQKDALLKEGCVLGQGFHYGRPMAVEEFERRYLISAEKRQGEKS